jgi:hypothetical protein
VPSTHQSRHGKSLYYYPNKVPSQVFLGWWNIASIINTAYKRKSCHWVLDHKWTGKFFS